jgi:hypothetical protein
MVCIVTFKVLNFKFLNKAFFLVLFPLFYTEDGVINTAKT